MSGFLEWAIVFVICVFFLCRKARETDGSLVLRSPLPTSADFLLAVFL